MNLGRRPASEADFDFARRAHHEAYRDVVERQFGSWVEEEQDRFFAGDWVGHDFEIVLFDDAPCGYVSIEERADAIVVRELVVLPAFHWRGIGTCLLREQMERDRRLGVPVKLGTLHENRAAHLYRRLGFGETGRTPTHILMERNPT